MDIMTNVNIYSVKEETVLFEMGSFISKLNDSVKKGHQVAFGGHTPRTVPKKCHLMYLIFFLGGREGAQLQEVVHY